MLVDSHCHLQDPKFKRDLDAVLQRAGEAGVTAMVTIGYDMASSRRGIDIADSHEDVYATVGVHPDYPDAGSIAVNELLTLADHPKVVAIGETGLDYYRLAGDLEWQRERFRVHIRAAKACGKPLVIHTR